MENLGLMANHLIVPVRIQTKCMSVLGLLQLLLQPFSLFLSGVLCMVPSPGTNVLRESNEINE